MLNQQLLSLDIFKNVDKKILYSITMLSMYSRRNNISLIVGTENDKVLCIVKNSNYQLGVTENPTTKQLTCISSLCGKRISTIDVQYSNGAAVTVCILLFLDFIVNLANWRFIYLGR